MQIEKKQNAGTLPSSAATSRGSKVAQKYAATFPTQLALARWTRGGDIPHTYISKHQAPLRAAWYAQAQRSFQAWLEAGGFRQSVPEIPDNAVHDPLACPAQDASYALLMPDLHAASMHDTLDLPAGTAASHPPQYDPADPGFPDAGSSGTVAGDTGTK